MNCVRNEIDSLSPAAAPATAMLRRAVDEFLAGNALAEQTLSGLREKLAERSCRTCAPHVAAIDVMLDIRAGRFGRAEVAARRLAEQGQRPRGYFPPLVAIRWYQGRIGELTPALSRAAEGDHARIAAMAVASASAGDERSARTAMGRLREQGLARLWFSGNGLLGVYGAVEAAYLLGDQPVAEEAYDLLLPSVDRPLMADLATVCFGSVQQALGVAALTMGRPDLAIAHLSAAVPANLRLGHRPAAVVAQMRLAHALDLRSRTGDAEQAARHRHTARSAAEALAMPQPDRAWPAVAPNWSSGQLSGPAICRRRGRRWEIVLDGHRTLVEPSRGVQYLAILIANPGQEIAAAELASGLGHGSHAALLDSATAQPLLDDAAKRDYRRRLRALQQQIEAYEQTGDLARANELHAERGWLLDQLAEASGFAGRTRTFADGGERARIAVGKAIRRAIERITDVDPSVGRTLRATVQTGTRCSYRPFDPARHREAAVVE